MPFVLVLVAALLILRLAAELILSALNRAEVRRHSPSTGSGQASPPPAVRAIMDGATYARSIDYTLAKSRFGTVTEIFDAVILAAVVFSGVLPPLAAHISNWGAPGAAWTGAAFIVGAILLLSVFSLPFDAWESFRLEARFGFNRTTPGLWLADKAKGALLGLAIGFPLLWGLLALIGRVGPTWWIWASGLIFVFQLIMLILYPKLILPLFNRLEPLAPGPLRDRLLALGDRTGFRAAAIQVIDGSRRSAHANAYFTGFGRFRRIVLYDTLVKALKPTELEAVLAHEIGHYRRHHIPQRLALSAASLVGGLALLAWLNRTSWFNPAFGFPAGAIAPSFLLAGLLSGLATFWFSPLTNLLSRKHEFEADAFAREAMGGPDPLIGALRRLAEKNLSNLTPHPAFSTFYYSHPTLVERERALVRL